MLVLSPFYSATFGTCREPLACKQGDPLTLRRIGAALCVVIIHTLKLSPGVCPCFWQSRGSSAEHAGDQRLVSPPVMTSSSQTRGSSAWSSTDSRHWSGKEVEKLRSSH